jgi:uncharacterized protein YjiS (DUF1127 family)
VRRDRLGGEKAMSVITLHPSRSRLGPAPQHPSLATSAAFKARYYLVSLANRIHNRWQHRATIAVLGALSDRQLRDIGVNRTDIRSLVNERHHERARGYVDWRRHDPRY